MLSVKELFKVGRGPSSSHTIGPMRACRYMLEHYESKGIGKIKVTLYGSFALTGRGHLTDRGIKEVFAKYPVEIIWDYDTVTKHPNTMDVVLFNKSGKKIVNKRFESIGGGTIVVVGDKPQKDVYPFKNYAEMKKEMLSKNLDPFTFLCQYEDKKELIKLYDEMIESFEGTIKDGLKKTGKIEGRIEFDRRAKTVYDSIKGDEPEPAIRFKKVSAYAMATNEEAVSYGMVVTTPTCGSAGIMPAVYKYAVDTYKPSKEKIYEALSAAALFGITIKQNGSVAGATGGCQAEVGVATALSAAMYGVIAYDAGVREIEKAAEAALQHVIGLTCDPVGEGCFVPCIQRCALYANRAIDAAILAHVMRNMRQLVFMDDTIKGAYESGNEIREGYRETSKSGLAKYAAYTVKIRPEYQQAAQAPKEKAKKK